MLFLIFVLSFICCTANAGFLKVSDEPQAAQKISDVNLYDPSTDDDPSDEIDQFKSLSEIVRENGF